MSAKSIFCHKCNHVWEFVPPMGRREECPSCKSDSRCCLNCQFHDRAAYRECREEQAEWVKEKTAGNFCGFFAANTNRRGTTPEAEATRAKLESLFGGTKPNDQVAESSENAKISLQDELAKFLNTKK